MQRDEIVKEMVKSGDEGVEAVVHDYLTEQGVEEYYIKQAIVACKLYRWMKQVYESPPAPNGGCVRLDFENGFIVIERLFSPKLLLNFRKKGQWMAQGTSKYVKTGKRGLTNILIQSTSIARSIYRRNWELYEELAKV